MQYENIRKYFEAVNSIVISQMYLNKFKKDNNILNEDLKEYNPGHLGTSMSLNFILANLYYYINKNNINSQIIIGTGHSGVSLISNLWINGTLEKYYKKYSRNINGLNKLINDFGSKIRSEINPEYPETIYDGGELGYSLGIAYGYSIYSNVDLIPCIIGDGEAETGTLSASWNLPKIIKSTSKVFPIINLNGLKMGSESMLSKMSDREIKRHFKSLGYTVCIVNSNDNILSTIKKMQNAINYLIKKDNPLLIFKSLKGFTLPNVDNYKFQGEIGVHKNPLQCINDKDKTKVISKFLENYDTDIFDKSGNLLKVFDEFSISTPRNSINGYIEDSNVIKELKRKYKSLDELLYSYLRANNGLVFSPDEIYSNKFEDCAEISIEILNENLLQALYQGFVQAGNTGFYISYEGFMPIISSMVTQYYKYLKQKVNSVNYKKKNSLNYILTSTCWENTYSHQNPDFVNTLYEKKDTFYNILYPKDYNNSVKCIEYFISTSDQINIMTLSKRHKTQYQSYEKTNITIETVIQNKNPDLIICVTGDYMLDQAYRVYDILTEKKYNVKLVYVTKPQILSVNSKEALNEKKFESFFNNNVPILYLFTGYSNTIKSLIFERKVNCTVLGYDDGISHQGNLQNNLESNGLSSYDIIKQSEKIINKYKE